MKSIFLAVFFLSVFSYATQLDTLIYTDGNEGTAGECLLSSDTAGTVIWDTCPGGASGSGTDERLVRWDGTSNIQDSSVAVTDGGNMTPAGGSQDFGSDSTGTWNAIYGKSIIARPTAGGLALNVQTASVSKGRLSTDTATPSSGVTVEFLVHSIGNTSTFGLAQADNTSAADNKDAYIETGDQTAVGYSFKGPSLQFKTGDITSGTATGDGGDFVFTSGSNSGSGARGTMFFDVASTAGASNGFVWTLDDNTTGKGSWQAAAGGTVGGTGTDNRVMRWDGTADAQDSNISMADTSGNLQNETAAQDWSLQTVATSGATNSGDLTLASGNCVDGICGDVRLVPGTESGTGTNGNVDVVLGVSGQSLDFTNQARIRFANTAVIDMNSAGIKSVDPATSDTHSFGRDGNRWNKFVANQFELHKSASGIQSGGIFSGTITGPRGGTGEVGFQNTRTTGTEGNRALIITTADATDTTNAGDLILEAGDNSNGTSGDGGEISLRHGTSAAGTPGSVNIDSVIKFNPRSSTSLTADDQVMTVNDTYEKFISDNATATNRTFTLTNGEHEGQLLYLVNISSNQAELVDGGNAALSGTMTFNSIDDTLHLIWDGDSWNEISRSDN